MRNANPKSNRTTLTLLLTALVALGTISLAHADRDRDDRRHVDQRDRHDAKPYRSGHWVLDRRFHHNHYYPAPGYSVHVLPPGYLDISVNRGRLLFSAGVWFRPQGRGYRVVTPPPGTYLPILPPDYTTFWVSNTPYFYANNVYYTPAPTGGYVVAAPPPDTQIVMQPPPPPAAPAPYSAPIGDGLIVYPKNGQSTAQTAADRTECTHWAIDQTGFDPSRATPDDTRRADFQRAASACLEAHGYTVK